MNLGDKKPSQLLKEIHDLVGAASIEPHDRFPTTVVVAVLEGSKENLDGKSALVNKLPYPTHFP